LEQENLVDDKNLDRAAKPSPISRNKSRLALDHRFKGFFFKPLDEDSVMASYGSVESNVSDNVLENNENKTRENDSCIDLMKCVHIYT
jgi:hypothetical protein